MGSGNPITETLARNIAFARKVRRKSQTEVAKWLGVNVRTIWTWETGSQEPKHDSLLSLSKCLDVPWQWFYANSNVEAGEISTEQEAIPPVVFTIYDAIQRQVPNLPALPPHLLSDDDDPLTRHSQTQTHTAEVVCTVNQVDFSQDCELEPVPPQLIASAYEVLASLPGRYKQPPVR